MRFIGLLGVVNCLICVTSSICWATQTSNFAAKLEQVVSADTVETKGPSKVLHLQGKTQEGELCALSAVIMIKQNDSHTSLIAGLVLAQTSNQTFSRGYDRFKV
jgi:hypothetical protein